MTKIKTSVALDEDLLKWIDSQIEKKRFANRTHAIEYAIQQLIESDRRAGVPSGYFPQSTELILADKRNKAYQKRGTK